MALKSSAQIKRGDISSLSSFTLRHRTFYVLNDLEICPHYHLSRMHQSLHRINIRKYYTLSFCCSSANLLIG